MKYTKEQLAELVVVPASVENELKRLMEQKLSQCGLFFRVFSRIKSPESLEHKFSIKDYNEEKKIQDLLGFRINLYFQDDLKIVKKVLEELFVHEEWAENHLEINNFEPMKINGVFRMPEYLSMKISDSVWELPIDKTFEVQLKTAFFEGWHEVEHDMRYKNIEVWKKHDSYARRFNSIVATLELCDRSMIDIFEDLGHRLYKEGDWAGMIRMHFRIRISDQPIYEEFVDLLEEDQKKLGKKIYKYDRSKLIYFLSTFYRDIPISVNMIISIINDMDWHNERISEISRGHRVYHDGIVSKDYEKKKYVLRKLKRFPVYYNYVTIDSDRENRQAVFERVSDYMFHWAQHKFAHVFEAFATEKKTICMKTDGYEIQMKYEDFYFELYTSHIAAAVPGRIWYTGGRIFLNEDHLVLEVKNTISDSQDFSEEEQVNYFSVPGFFSDICRDNSIAIRDVRRLKEKVKRLNEDEKTIYDFEDLLRNQNRRLPVVLIVCPENAEQQEAEWLPPYWKSNLVRWIKYHAHVYEMGEESAESIATIMGEEALAQGVYLIPSQRLQRELEKPIAYYSPEDILQWKIKPGNLGMVRSDRTEGSKAFMNDLVREIKRQNVLDFSQ